jgi:hypothetical protein
MKELKNLITVPVFSERNIIMDAEGRTALVVDFTHPSAIEICKALCTLINAQNGDGSTLNSGWISVEERLPEIEDDVIVVTNQDTKAGLLYYQPMFIGSLLKDSRWYANGQQIFGVTHWQPLPSLPKTKNK